MATTPGKTDRYYPNSGWQPASYVGGFMPGVVPDQQVAKSPAAPFYPNSMIDGSFASLGTPSSAPAVAQNNGPAWNTPTAIDLAAIDKWNAGMSPGASTDSMMAMFPNAPTNPAVAAATGVGASNNVTGKLKPQHGGGLFDLLFGPSKNGMGGLAGLLGGKNAGGLLGLLTQARGAAPARTGPSGVGTNGYTYVNGQNMGYSPEVQASRTAQGIAIGDANRANPNPTYNVSGDNNAFAPTSVQNSTRWQTGY